MRTRLILVPFVLCTMGALALILSGCGGDEGKSSEAAAPEQKAVVYLDDATFHRELQAKRKELQAVVNERAPLVARMEELVRAHGQDLAALQKVDEWTALHKKVTELNAKYEEVRKRQLVLAARKMNPSAEKKVSK